MDITKNRLRNGDVIDNINYDKLDRMDIAELNRRIDELNHDIEILMDKISLERKSDYNKQYGIKSPLDKLLKKLYPLESELNYLHRLREYTINHMSYKVEVPEKHSYDETPLDIAVKNKRKQNDYEGFHW